MNGKPTLPQLRSLIGNPNAYAVQKPDGTYYKVLEPLSNAVLQKHLKGELTVGTYLVKPPDQARTLVLDIDSGEETAHGEALRIVAALENLGVPRRSIGVEFSGGKGYHVWTVVGSYTDAARLRQLGLAAKAIAGVDCEVYPKQNQVKELGNLIKLPGGIHQKTKKANNFIISYPTPQPLSLAVFDRVTKALPTPEVKKSEAPPALECMANIQEGVEEGGRNHALFHLAVMLRRGGLADEFVADVVRTVAVRCVPPLEDAEVDALLQSSTTGGPICGTLPDNLRCAECPVLRPKGLYSKPGQLKFGAEGELAVIQLGKRTKDGVIEIIHPDVTFGKLRV
jgi:hypothetical protein